MLKVSVDTVHIRQAMKELDNVNPELKKYMRKELKDALAPEVAQIKGSIPVMPLSGMARESRLQWSPKIRANVSVTPGSSKFGRSFISIKITSANEAAFKMVELAGTRMQIKTRQGAAMVRVLGERYPLKGKGGRFAWAKFMAVRPDVINRAENIVNKYMALINRKFD